MDARRNENMFDGGELEMTNAQSKRHAKRVVFSSFISQM